MKIGKNMGRKGAKQRFRGDRLKIIQKIAKYVGMKILQKDLIKYTVPLVSIAVGGTWNYTSTRLIGKVAQRHFQAISTEVYHSEKSRIEPSEVSSGASLPIEEIVHEIGQD